MDTFSERNRDRHQLLLLLLALLACFCECKCKEKPLPPKPSIDTNGVFVPTDLSMVWIRPYHSDTSYDGSGFPLLTGDYVVFANNSGVYPQNGGFGIYNKKTGEEHPAWQSEVGEQLGTTDKLITSNLAGKNNELLIVGSHKRIYAFDIHSGAKLWTKEVNQPNTVTNVIFGDYYLIHTPHYNKKNIVVRLDAYTGKQTNYFAHVYKDDAYTMVGLNPPSGYVDNNGDTLLFCISGDWAPKEYAGRVWAYCYNTTKNRMQWINKNFTDERDVCGTVAPPILYDHNKWIIQTHRGLHCMDANTGELIWKNLYWLEYYSDGKNDSIGGMAELFTMTFSPMSR